MDMKSGLIVDDDVLAVAQFMHRRIAANRLVAVAGGLAALAPLLWGGYEAEPVTTLRLDVGAISGAEKGEPQ